MQHKNKYINNHDNQTHKILKHLPDKTRRQKFTGNLSWLITEQTTSRLALDLAVGVLFLSGTVWFGAARTSGWWIAQWPGSSFRRSSVSLVHWAVGSARAARLDCGQIITVRHWPQINGWSHKRCQTIRNITLCLPYRLPNLSQRAAAHNLALYFTVTLQSKLPLSRQQKTWLVSRVN